MRRLRRRGLAGMTALYTQYNDLTMVTIAVRPAGGAALRRATRCALFGAVHAPLAYLCVYCDVGRVCDACGRFIWSQDFLSDVLSPLRLRCLDLDFWFHRGRFHSSTPALQAVPPLWRAWPIERAAAAVVSDVAVVSDDGVTTASAEAAADHRVERKSQGEPSERARLESQARQLG